MIADEIECSGGAPCPDSDNDGITDVLDLDSDNDGIYDIAEYGYSSNDLDNDGVFDGNNNPLLISINGFPKTIDPAVTGTTYPARPDHDGDGIPDLGVGVERPITSSYQGGLFVFLLNSNGSVKKSKFISDGISNFGWISFNQLE